MRTFIKDKQNPATLKKSLKIIGKKLIIPNFSIMQPVLNDSKE